MTVPLNVTMNYTFADTHQTLTFSSELSALGEQRDGTKCHDTTGLLISLQSE